MDKFREAIPNNSALHEIAAVVSLPRNDILIMSLFSKKKKNNISQKSWQRKNKRAYSSKSGEEKPKKRGLLSRFFFWMLFIAFLVICAYLLLFSTFLDIDKVSVEGNQDILSMDITKAVEVSLEGNYWRYFPRKNFFLVSQKDIDTTVKKNFNRLEIASIEKKFPSTINLKVIEHKAELVWCSGGVCYFVDSSGLAYSGAAGTEKELRDRNFLVVVDDSARPIEIGETKINADYIKYIEEVNVMIQDDLKIGAIESYHTPGIASWEISVITNGGWILKISSEYSIDEAKKIIQTLFDKDLDEEKRKNLEYLDMRIKNKVYYKIKPEEEKGPSE